MADKATQRKGEYRSGHDPRTLRDALGCFATGVTVVTCLNDERRAGRASRSTASPRCRSIRRCCWCACYKQAASAAALTSASHFAINVLQTGQQPASITFSTRVEDRFGAMPWSCGEAARRSSRIRWACSNASGYAVYDGGDHHILVGQVVKASFDASLDPLLYFRGRYRRLHFD